MTNEPQTGPWILALGTLAVGVAAVTAEVARRRRSNDAEPEQRGRALD